MSLADLLPVVRSLSADEQDQLLQWLSDEKSRREVVANHDDVLIAQLIAAAPFQPYRPECGPEAVAALEQLLAEHRAELPGQR
jgi:hypothetical protein